jgi:hypothetical protein
MFANRNKELPAAECALKASGLEQIDLPGKAGGLMPDLPLDIHYATGGIEVVNFNHISERS